jgi:hypothetical protein
MTDSEVAEVVGTPKTKMELNKERQGEKVGKTKKVNKLTKAEVLAEMHRLERAGHQGSDYYFHISARAQELK